MSTPGLGPHDRFHVPFEAWFMDQASAARAFRHRPGSEPVPLEGYLAAIAERVLIEEGVALPGLHITHPGDDEALSEFEEVWSVQLRDADLDLSHWADMAVQFG